MPAARKEVGSWRTPTVRVPPLTAAGLLVTFGVVLLPPPLLPQAARTTSAVAPRAPAIRCPIRVRLMDSLLPPDPSMSMGAVSPRMPGHSAEAAAAHTSPVRMILWTIRPIYSAGCIGPRRDMIDRLRRPRRSRSVTPRRFRSRVLVAMLTVALVPLGIFAVVVAADLGAVTRSTVDETNRAILRDQADAQQRQVADQAQALRVQVDRVAATLRALRDLAVQSL